MDAACLLPEADVWAAEIAANADLPDDRLNQRFSAILATFAARPLDSIPQACGASKDAKATYRFLSNSRVEADDLLQALTAVTTEDCRGRPIVLAVQDTTSLNYSMLQATTGLGPVGSSEQARGLYLHTTLALRLDGVAIGLLHQSCWSRSSDERTSSERDHRPIEDKESVKWLRGLNGVAAALDRLPDNQRPRIIHLMDREGDIHEVLQAIAASADSAIIRSMQNRLVAEPIRRAHDAVAAAPLLGTKVIDVPASQGKPKRRARLELRSITTTITPSRKHRGHSQRQPLAWSLVEAREVDAPPDIQPLHWLLWTLEPVQTRAQVLEVVRLYKLRWHVEDFHLTLKSGCQAESLELETADRLEKAITIYSAVAVRILALRDLARHEPDAPCTTILSADAWKALWLRIHQKSMPANMPVPTVHDAVRWIGRLGGHLNRKPDGMPGVRTLWRGWRDLTLLVAGYRLARSHT